MPLYSEYAENIDEALAVLQFHGYTAVPFTRKTLRDGSTYVAEWRVNSYGPRYMSTDEVITFARNLEALV